MIQLRDYQVKLSNEATDILKRKGLVILCLAVRTGKTLTSLQTAENYGAKNVLFVTKLKAFSSIQSDYDQMNFSFKITIINKESLHKVDDNFDLVVYDEFHGYCFLGETLINGVKIKDIKIGSFQKSFNFVKGIYEDKEVLNVFKNPLTENLVKIKCNGKEIVCTENHKISTRRGWVKAKDILPEDELQVV